MEPPSIQSVLLVVAVVLKTLPFEGGDSSMFGILVSSNEAVDSPNEGAEAAEPHADPPNHAKNIALSFFPNASLCQGMCHY